MPDADQVAALESSSGADGLEWRAAVRVLAVRRWARRPTTAGWTLESPIPRRRSAAQRNARREPARVHLHDAANGRSGQSADPLAFLLAFDFDRDAPQIVATTSGFPDRPWSSWRRRLAISRLAEPKRPAAKSSSSTARATACSRCNRRSIGTRSYVRTMAVMSMILHAFAPVPGMTHCGGGPATDRFDLFSALVDWVEQGSAPESPRRPSSAPTIRNCRPLGAKRARARSAPGPRSRATAARASVESAASFVCE